MNGNVKGVLLAAALLALAACGDKKDDKKAAPAGGSGDKAAAPSGGGETYDAAKSTASVKFTIKWTGAKPEQQPVMITEATCKKDAPVMQERYVVNDDGALPNAFVWAKSDGKLKGMTGFSAPGPMTLDQHGCMYVPHVFGVRVGQTMTVKNSDGITHNINCKPQTNKPFNVAQSTNTSNDFTFTTRETAVPFNCDIHSWMNATAFVLDHPFFGTTDKTGTVEIKGLPAGDYTFKVWHEPFTTAQGKGIESELKVTLKDGEAATKTIELK